MTPEYYYITVHYTNHFPGRKTRMSGHVIRAVSRMNALDIRRRYGISFPRFAGDIKCVFCTEMDDPIVLSRRRRGQGGNIWYEENGEIHKEI